jgi:DNA invertase Pin-like site-specific DNA recombinase
MGEAMNTLEAFLRSMASGATFDAANNIAAAGDATIPLDNGASRAPNWHERYAANLRLQEQRDALARAQHGTAWQIGDAAGSMANPVWKYIPTAATTMGIASNMPLLMLPQFTEPAQDRPKDGIFGPHGWLSHFGGYSMSLDGHIQIAYVGWVFVNEGDSMVSGQFVAYYRVSTDKQGKSGLGLDAQKSDVMNWLNGGKWDLLESFTEHESGKRHDNRPQLRAALELCRKRKATLVIAKLDRLTRNAAFLGNLLESEIKFVAVDNPNATPLTIRILAAVAQEEREQISKRTKAALAAKKARGGLLGFANPRRSGPRPKAAGKTRGEKISREAQLFAANILPVIESIQKDAGIKTLSGIADALNARGIASARGTRWYASSVRNVMLR